MDRDTAIGNRIENLAKFGHVVFEICEWTYRQTDITILRTHLGVK